MLKLQVKTCFLDRTKYWEVVKMSTKSAGLWFIGLMIITILAITSIQFKREDQVFPVLSDENRETSGMQANSSETSLNEHVAPNDSSAGGSQGPYHRSNNLLKALDDHAIELGWSYDELTSNKMLWAPLCNDPSVIEALESDQNESFDEGMRRFAVFCRGFAEFSSGEAEEFGFVWDEERKQNTTDYAGFRENAMAMDLATRLRFAGSELHDAIDQLNEGKMLDIIGLLAFTGSLDELIASPAPRYDLSAVSHVSTMILCARLGGCDGKHPLTVRHCLSFRPRTCNDPSDLREAISDLTTGLEIEAVNDLLERLEILLARSP